MNVIRLLACMMLGVLCCNVGLGQVSFSSNFDNGRLDTSYQDGSGAFQLWPETNLHARVVGVNNAQPTFSIFDSVGHHLRSYHYMVYRYAADTNWHFFDTAYKAGGTDYYYFKNLSNFTSDTIFLAYWFPYTYGDIQQYMLSLQGEAHVRHAETKTTSYQGRSMYGFEITDTSIADCYKRHVVLTARQHPIENINGYFVEGFANYVMRGTDSISSYLRQHYRFFVYPMINPDGVYNGSGQNALGQGLNREWEDSLLSGGTPEVDSIRPIIFNETGQRVDWSIDLHSNPGSNIKYYWWGYTQNSAGVSQAQIQRSGNYVQAVAQQDATNGISLFQNGVQGNGVNSSLTAANWFRRTFGAVAYTFEPTSEPLGPTGDNRISIQRMRQAGASMAKGFYGLHDTLDPFGADIVQTGNDLSIHPFGGVMPYQITWRDSQGNQVNGPTYSNAANGTYRVEVIDSNGCMWSRDYVFSQSSIGRAEIAEPKDLLFYPNPVRGQFIQVRSDLIGCRFQLLDASGKVILNHLIHHERIELPSLESGIYFFQCRCEDEFLHLKLIKL